MTLPRPPLSFLVAVALAGAAVACGSSTPARPAANLGGPCREVSECPATGTACATAVCDNGRCSTIDADSVTTCDDHGGRVCDGAGACVECNLDAECATTTNPCAEPLCGGHVCTFQNSGAELAQTPNDCQTVACQGLALVATSDPGDIVSTTWTPCISLVCDIKSTDPFVVGTLAVPDLHATCDLGGTPGHCNPAGDCVECAFPDQCPVSTDGCHYPTCGYPDYTCGVAQAETGFACTTVDGRAGQCDAAGSCVLP